MRKIFLVLWSIIIYVCVCFTEMLLWNKAVISHYGFESYSVAEILFLILIVLISVLSVIFLLQSDKLKSFLINTATLWVTFIILNHLINARLWIGILTNHEADVLGVNFLSQDIWFYHYIGCIIGTVIAGIISLLKQKKTKSEINKK